MISQYILFQFPCQVVTENNTNVDVVQCHVKASVDDDFSELPTVNVHSFLRSTPNFSSTAQKQLTHPTDGTESRVVYKRRRVQLGHPRRYDVLSSSANRSTRHGSFVTIGISTKLSIRNVTLLVLIWPIITRTTVQVRIRLGKSVPTRIHCTRLCLSRYLIPMNRRSGLGKLRSRSSPSPIVSRPSASYGTLSQMRTASFQGSMNVQYYAVRDNQNPGSMKLERIRCRFISTALRKQSVYQQA